jgi:protein-disulfide isomerase
MKSILENVSPKTALIFGVVQGVLVLCMIGFFIMLGLYFKSDSTLAGSNKPSVVNPSIPSAPTGNDPIPANIALTAITDKDYYKGGKNAKVTIVEFSDTECPFCKRFHMTMNEVMKKYGDKVKWVYKHAPLDSLHSKARKEAQAVECAGDQGGNDGYWKYLDKLLEVTPSNNGLDEGQLPQIAQDVGLNRKKFEECLASEKFKDKVQSQLKEAEAAGMNGTPYSVIVAGDQKIPLNGALPTAQVTSIIDSLLK